MIETRLLENLQGFIVRAKAATYAGGGPPTRPCRPGSHDLEFKEGAWSYLDSYFGGRDFLGQEVVYLDGKPVWAMNYYGTLLLPELVTPEQVGGMLRTSLTRLYAENRFLGGFLYNLGEFVYIDTNTGDLTHFNGKETLVKGSREVYELVYHGGLIKDD